VAKKLIQLLSKRKEEESLGENQKGFIGSSKATTKATTTTVATSDLNLNRTTRKAAVTIAAGEAIDTTTRRSFVQSLGY